jgi:nucleotide-binding universal stress UspA family protein
VINGEAANASLVVVGSHGRGAVARFLLGSVSHGVLARLAAPTVIAR